MAMPIVRAAAVYWRNRKAASINKLRVKFMMGRTEVFGQDAVLAYSQGIATMEITITEIVTVGGSAVVDDIVLLIAQKNIPIAFFLGGKYFRQDIAITDYEIDSDSEKGVITGVVNGKGAAPKVIG